MRLHHLVLFLALFAGTSPAASQPFAPQSSDRHSAGLAEGAELFAGAPVVIDQRLKDRSCTSHGGFTFGWAVAAGTAVEARCAASGERLVLPLAARPPVEPQRLRRGDSVQAEVQGPGFRISVGAIAESSDRSGRLLLKNSRSGQRFAGRLDSVGRIIASETGN